MVLVSRIGVSRGVMMFVLVGVAVIAVMMRMLVGVAVIAMMMLVFAFVHIGLAGSGGK